MKLGHWILIAGAVLLLIYLMSSKTTTPYYGVGGTWYDKLLSGVGLGLGSYVRAAGPNAFGGPVTSGGVATVNPAAGGSYYGGGLAGSGTYVGSGYKSTSANTQGGTSDEAFAADYVKYYGGYVQE